MDDLQQRIVEIAQQIPGYAGYQAKERRREADKHVRMQLAARYEEQRARVARLQQQAALEHADDLEQIDQKLQRLIARLKTAPRGYAGWFDAAQIVEGDLDALTQFDSALAEGVVGLKTALDQIGLALKTKKAAGDALSACAESLDTLNTQLDQREQFVALGKKPAVTFTAPVSPLEALRTKKAPPPDLVALANLKLRDAVSYDGADYIVAGKISYKTETGSFSAFLLQDGDNKRWLRVGPGEETAVCQEITFDVPSPLPDTLTHDRQTFARGVSGQAAVAVEGAGGAKRGSVDYARYAAGAARLWAENFGTETRVMLGQTIDLSELKVYQR